MQSSLSRKPAALALAAVLVAGLSAGETRAASDGERYNAQASVFNSDAVLAGWAYEKATDYFSDSDNRTACRLVAVYLVNEQHALTAHGEMAQLHATDAARAREDADTAARMQTDLTERRQLYRDNCRSVSVTDAGFGKTIAALQRLGDHLAQLATLSALVEPGGSGRNAPSCHAARQATEVYLTALDEITLTRRQSAEAKTPPPATAAAFEASLRGGLGNARALLTTCPSYMQR